MGVVGRHGASNSYEMDFQVWAQGRHCWGRVSGGERGRASAGFTESDVSGNEDSNSPRTSHAITSDVFLTEPARVTSLLFNWYLPSGLTQTSRCSNLLGPPLAGPGAPPLGPRSLFD